MIIMGKLTELTMKYSYNDIMVKPAILSSIQHRAECKPYYKDGMLPLFTAPMDSVVGKENFDLFEKHGIIPILPRTEELEDRLDYAFKGKWAAFSLQEFEKWFTDETASKTDIKKIRALIDIANGHVERLYALVSKSKAIFGTHIEVMVGNIANPETYRACVESQVDYVRCSVGTGAGCITCSNTAIGYPIASLISEIAAIKREYIENDVFDKDSLPKIIADGGIRNYNDVIKAIALGADYVMCGSIFSKMMESSSVKFMNRSGSTKKIHLRFPIERYENLRYENGRWVGNYTDEFIKKMAENGREVEKENHNIGQVYSKFYGMASRAGQIAMKGKKVHTSEGIEKVLEVTYTIKTWVENMTDYLRSAMSYTNSRTLDELKQAEVVIASMNTYNSINK